MSFPKAALSCLLFPLFSPRVCRSYLLGDDAVEGRALVGQRFAAGRADALLAGAQGAEVLDGLRDGLAIEAHDDAAGGLAADVDVEEDLHLREQ